MRKSRRSFCPHCVTPGIVLDALTKAAE